ncbi:chitin synthase chs-2-like, partial [Agrilus planipennis]|uniref:Chitin synthase chs-2-like n=1 Tax=Agrilus planipennis TaxID=224129 RepID=A0A7F5RHT3_AGRPL
MAPVWVFVINVLGSYVCYIFGKFACKIMVQTYCYAFPINLTVPTLITALVAFCGVYSIDECAFKNAIPQYLAFNGPPLYFVRNFIENEFAWLWLIWLLSQTWISFHIWNPRVERLARTEKLFAKPMYDGVFVDQSLALNRKRNYKSIIEEEKDWSDSYSENSASTEDYSEASSSPPIQEDETTRIYACATMWHETTEEMMEFLKSIFRLDEDQCAKRLAKNYLEVDIPDYFEIEITISRQKAELTDEELLEKDPVRMRCRKENRWLCTLLLQRGYRVEYSAASDAYTHAPEGFNEFFNQRRRWMPSTCANIMDLIQDSKKTIAVNDNISRGYIFYHIVLMVGTVLGPGTLMLMVIGALVTVFSFDQYTSLKWNVTPLIIFMISCYYCKANIQLIMAAIISGVYALVMMAVLVGVTLQIFEDGWLAPSNLFLMLVAGEFIIAAILHPKEFGCLPHGLIYFITIPCMYLILVIYSVFNLNNISWGTREVTVVPKAAADAEEEKDQKKDEKKEPTNLKAMQNRIFALFGKGDDNAGSFEFSCGGLFKILLCAYRKESPEQVELALLNNNIK